MQLQPINFGQPSNGPAPDAVTTTHVTAVSSGFIEVPQLNPPPLAVIPVLAADAGGKWVGEVKLPSGQTLPFVAHLTQQHSAITGKLDGIGGAPDVVIMDGKISGNTVTFSGVRRINNVDVKFNYVGTLAGDGIDFKITRADGSGAPLETQTKRTPQ